MSIEKRIEIAFVVALLLLSCLAFFVVDLFLALMLASLAIVRLIVKVWKLEDLWELTSTEWYHSHTVRQHMHLTEEEY